MRTISELIGSIAGGGSSAHAYLVEGDGAYERKSFIEKLAMGLECSCSDIAGRPCGRCPSCRQIKAGTGMDIVRMQMSGKTSYQVKDADEFTERLSMGSYGRYLIGIIDDADCLTEAVQNKLLKTLEEPHDSVIMLLGTSNRDRLLSTVRSRCGVVRLQDYEEGALGESAGTDEIRRAAELMLGRTAAFCEFREQADSCIKTPADAFMLIDALEDGLRDNMINGNNATAFAGMIETCELARVDIERGMDKNKALRRLFLELPGM